MRENLKSCVLNSGVKSLFLAWLGLTPGIPDGVRTSASRRFRGPLLAPGDTHYDRLGVAGLKYSAITPIVDLLRGKKVGSLGPPCAPHFQNVIPSIQGSG